mmetsp:Transcript_127163/g.354082  ORF Transcript_127163/g.354082 Transcript_127163/m.354082 type:complete len:174 (-) Transcript_127163:79-600(-)
MAEPGSWGRLTTLQRHVLAAGAVAANPDVPLVYNDDFIKSILAQVRVVAMVGASAQRDRPSHICMGYLQSKGYRVIPVNPTAKGELVYGNLGEIPEGTSFDMVDVFRSSEAVGPIVDQAIAMKASRGISVLWLQLGVRSKVAADIAMAAGLCVVMDRCPKIEHARLFGEFGGL